MMEQEQQADVFLDNTIKTNRRVMNMAFFSNAIGPLMAVGRWIGFFQVRYVLCIKALCYTLVISIVLWYMNKHKNWHNITKFTGLFFLEILLGTMATNATIGINISYGFLPFISCLYVDEILTAWVNAYCILVLAVSLYFRSYSQIATYGSPFTPKTWYIDNLMGFIIEYIFVFIITRGIVKYEKELMRNLASQVKKKYQAEQLNTIRTAFFAKMSHELRTPLNAICGMTELLKEKKLGQEDMQYVETIDTSGRTMLSIINSILDISKVQSGKMKMRKENYIPRNVMQDSAKLAASSVKGKEVKLKVQMDRRIPGCLSGDAGAITRILLNLLNNALKFTEEGTVTLRAYWIDTIAPEGILHMEVEDTGCGIRQEDLSRIFEDFEQAGNSQNSKYAGTGLGLTLCKSYTDAMQGKKWAESTWGEGSTFYIEIPQIIVKDTLSENLHKQEEHHTFEPSFTAPDVWIMIVDDNKTNIQVAAALMKCYQFKMTVCLSGKEALRRMTEERHFDLIFMDHLMPEMDGIEITEKLREMDTEYTRRIPIIALSADLVGNQEQVFLKHGMNDVLSKPIDRDMLDKILVHWLPSEKCIWKEKE